MTNQHYAYLEEKIVESFSNDAAQKFHNEIINGNKKIYPYN
jgi:hypothetical protein